jgi:hypothetical protein
MKPCRKCGAVDRTPAGRCRPCMKAYNDEHYKINTPRALETRAAYRAANREKVNAKSAECHKKNPECHRKASERYRNKNKEKCYSAQERSRIAKPHKYRAYVRTRQASKLKATPAWINQFFVGEIYDLAELRTKAIGFKWQVDHIVPLQSKLVCGLHWEINLQVLPEGVNKSKGNRWWPDMPMPDNKQDDQATILDMYQRIVA